MKQVWDYITRDRFHISLELEINLSFKYLRLEISFMHKIYFSNPLAFLFLYRSLSCFTNCTLFDLKLKLKQKIPF